MTNQNTKTVQLLLKSLPWIQEMSFQAGKRAKHPMTNNSGDLPILSYINKLKLFLIFYSVILIFDSLFLISITVQPSYERTILFFRFIQKPP